MCRAVAHCLAVRHADLNFAEWARYDMTLDDIDFLIIGAAKSATTAIQRALQKDASVFMPDPELHYFSREYHRGHSWYTSQFAGAQPKQIVGEKSNSYFDTPEAAARIRISLPQAKLIAQLRNPVERAYSDYCMLYRRAEVGKDIDRHLDPRTAAAERFVRGGLYYEQLVRFFDLYPAGQLMVVLFEDFKQRGELQLSDIRRFIGLPVGPGRELGTTIVKDKTTPMLSPELRRRLGWLKPMVAPFRQIAGFEAFRQLLVREIRYPPLRLDLRNRLIEFYSSDVEKLGRLLGRDLSQWLTDTPGTSPNKPAGFDREAKQLIR